MPVKSQKQKKSPSLALPSGPALVDGKRLAKIAPALSRELRANADILRLAKLEPQMKVLRAKNEAVFQQKIDRLLAIPEEQRSHAQKKRLVNLGALLVYMMVKYPEQYGLAPKNALSRSCGPSPTSAVAAARHNNKSTRGGNRPELQ